MAGGGLLALASAAAVVTAAVLLISQDQSGATAQCPPTPSWVQQAALQAEAAAPAGGTLQPDGDALGAVTGLAADAMRRVGWRVGVRFARFGETLHDEKRRWKGEANWCEQQGCSQQLGGSAGRSLARLQQDQCAVSYVPAILAPRPEPRLHAAPRHATPTDASASLQGALANPAAHAGAFLLLVPGNGTLARRPQRLPFLALDPAAKNLAAALAPAVAALNAAAGALEAALKRRLFAFHLDEAALAGCAAGTGVKHTLRASCGALLPTSIAGQCAVPPLLPRCLSPACAMFPTLCLSSDPFPCVVCGPPPLPQAPALCGRPAAAGCS